MALANHLYNDFYDCSGGMNTVSSGIRLKPNEAKEIQNMDLIPIGGFSKRNGYTLLNTFPVGTSACTGLYQARYSTIGGSNFQFLVSGTKLYSMPGTLSGTWTDRTGALTITAGNNNIWNFAILNDITVLGNGVDVPIQISASPAASALSSGLPFTSFLFPVESRGYMWYFRPTVSGNILYDRAYFSAINDPTTVGANDYIDIGKGQGGDLKGAVDYKTYLYAFKRNGIYQISFQPTTIDSAGDLFPWSQYPNPVIPGVGTQSHRSIVKFTTPSTHQTPGQELVFFVDQYGIPRIFDGVTTISFASKIGSSRDTSIISLSDMDNTRLPYCWAVNYPLKNRIEFFLSRTNSKQDTCWVLDYNTGFAISRKKYFDSFNVGCLFETSLGFFKPYFGDYAGTVFQNDQGTTDNGNAVSDYYITGDVYNKSPSLSSKWFFADLKGVNGSTSQSTKISYYPSIGDTPVKTDTVSLASSQAQWGAGTKWGAFQWAKKGLVSRTSEINLESKTLRIKIESANKSSDTLIIEGFGLASQILGTVRD